MFNVENAKHLQTNHDLRWAAQDYLPRNATAQQIAAIANTLFDIQQNFAGGSLYFVANENNAPQKAFYIKVNEENPSYASMKGAQDKVRQLPARHGYTVMPCRISERGSLSKVGAQGILLLHFKVQVAPRALQFQ